MGDILPSRVIIVGAGIAGAMAFSYFSTYNPIIFAKDTGIKHDAVFRVRDPRVGMLLGVPLEKIMVTKEVLWQDRLWDKASITAMNMYSLKTNGRIASRSISDLGVKERYLISGAYSINAERAVLKGIEAGSALVQNVHSGEEMAIPDDICISTIPLPVMLDACHEEYDRNLFRYEPIFVTRCSIKERDCTVNQTIYVPEMEYHTYRMTLEKETLIFESVGGYPEKEEVMALSKFFCVTPDAAVRSSQEFGKLLPHTADEDDLRRMHIFDLTEKYGVYSLGRFATWKSIRTDDLLDDLDHIMSVMGVSKIRRKYENKLNGIHK